VGRSTRKRPRKSGEEKFAQRPSYWCREERAKIVLE